MPAIVVEKLRKNYGSTPAVKDISFTVNEKEIFGFVGPNGAGKSTTIRVLLNFIFATEGKAEINGMDCVVDAKKIRTVTSYVPSDVRMYGDMKISEILNYHSKFYVKDQSAEQKRLCELFGVDEQKRFRELSTGNKKKVSLVCALSSKPKVLILDEPTSGLDPMVQKDLFQELKRQAADGMAILLSSHNLAEVQEYCDRVAFIRSGEIISISELAAMNRESKKVITIYGGKEIPSGFELLEQQDDKRILRTNADGVTLLDLLYQIEPASFTVEKEKIEDQFMKLYRKEEIR